MNIEQFYKILVCNFGIAGAFAIIIICGCIIFTIVAFIKEFFID